MTTKCTQSDHHWLRESKLAFRQGTVNPRAWVDADFGLNLVIAECADCHSTLSMDANDETDLQCKCAGGGGLCSDCAETIKIRGLYQPSGQSVD